MHSYVVFRVTLAESLKAQASVKVVLRAVFVDAMPPHPAAIAQSEAQLVRYQDNVYFAALYDSQSQKTAVRLASTIVESYSQHKPTSNFFSYFFLFFFQKKFYCFIFLDYFF